MNENKSISFPLSFTYKKIKAIFVLKDFFRVFLQMEKYIEILFFSLQLSNHTHRRENNIDHNLENGSLEEKRVILHLPLRFFFTDIHTDAE